MPVVSKITEQKRKPNRRNIFLDGAFAFGVNLNVVARFRLREGLTLTPEQIREIEIGEVRQECFDQATKYLSLRLHSRKELQTKLNRKEFGESIVTSVLEDLQRLGYLDDARFAKTRATTAAERKHHGRRRAMMELRKAGVTAAVADKALDEVYAATDALATARALVERQANRLRKLDPKVAKRRLVGMLQRRGFNYQDIQPVVTEFFGRQD